MAKPDKQPSTLKARILSAIILLPFSISLLMLGPPYGDCFIFLITCLLLKEWIELCGVGSLRSRGRALWFLGGGAYILAACAFFAALGHHKTLPFQTLLVLAAVSTDTSAYFIGRWWRGPKLAPDISPSKTWSGAVGGIIGSQIVLTGFFATFMFLKFPSCLPPLTRTIFIFMGFSLFLSMVAQCGDLLESGAKRAFKVKDSGTLIPGHGGFLDRLDSLLAISLVVGLIAALIKGA